MLIERKHSVSAFAALLVCAHPVTEVLFSIYRRRTKKINPGHPDQLHFHSLVKQRYVRMVRYQWCSPIHFLLVKPVQPGIRTTL